MTASPSEVMAGLVKALRSARQEIVNMAVVGTNKFADLGVICDPAPKTYGPAIERAGIDEALAAYESHERIQLASHYLDARGRSFPAQVEDDPPGLRHGRAM